MSKTLPPILKLCRRGQSERVFELAKSNPEVLDQRDFHNNGPLMCALYGKHVDLAISLLSMGADPFEVTLEPDWPMALALRNKLTDFIKAVVRNKELVPALFAQVWLGNRDRVESILREDKRSLEMFLPDDYCGMTPLSYAIACGDLEMVRLLIDNGADVDATKDRRRLYSPLITSLGSGLEFVETLLESGANPAGALCPVRRLEAGVVRIFQKFGLAGTPLICALLERNKKKAKSVLKDNPSQANGRCPNGFPALVLAVDMNDEELIRDMIAAGAAIDAQVACPTLPEFRDSALISAASKGIASIVKTLLELGANSDLEDHAAMKGAVWQYGYGYKQVSKPDYEGTIELLAKSGSRVQGLRHAVEAGSLERTEFLLSAGADINEVYETGHSPLDYCTGIASSWGRTAQTHPQLAAFLISHGALHSAQLQSRQ